MRSEGRGRCGWLIATAAWNWLINRVIPARHYTAANLAATAASIAVAHARGHPPRTLGLGRNNLVSGIRWGLLGGAAAAGTMWGASRIRGLTSLFDDDRVDPERTGFETLIRIPLGTVVLEETLFRGVLPVVTGSDYTAAIAFGAWHGLPTTAVLDINSVEDLDTRRIAIAGGVVGTALAAGPLRWLRNRSGSLLAPMLTHWAVNATGYVLAAHRRRDAALGDRV